MVRRGDRLPALSAEARAGVARLLERRAISQELVGKLLARKHPGFSAYVGEPIASQERQQLETVAAYLVKSPLSLKKLVYLDGSKRCCTGRR